MSKPATDDFGLSMTKRVDGVIAIGMRQQLFK
jgi:hypothetical protein